MLCLNDDEVRPIRDLGVTRDGTPTGQRQMIMRMLSSTTKTASGAVIALFALAEPPTKQWSESDPLDRALRDFNGAWQKPGPVWLAERQTRVDATKAQAAGLESRIRDMGQTALAEQLGKLVSTASASVAKQVAR
jgi:hypothetical protein